MTWSRVVDFSLEWLLKPVVGLFLGVLLTWVVTTIRRRMQDRRFRRIHSLAGRYLAYAEGERDRHNVRDKELLQITQSVGRLSGTARSVDGSRRWSLEGEIVDHGCLSGVYRADVQADKSRGTFFLEPRLGSKGDFDGVWAGYDSVNKRVRCGKYQWYRLLEPTIETLKPDSPHKARALAILSVSLGKKYINEPTFQGYLEGKGSRFALGAILDGEVIGVALAKVMEKDDMDYYDGRARQAGLRTALSPYQRVGHLKSIAVKDGFRRRGVGTALCQEATRLLKQAGCATVFTVAWESGSDQASMSLFSTIGFDTLGEVPEFWRVDNVQEDHQCPKCGFPCTCAALFCLLSRL